MKQELLKFLVCPFCKNKLHLKIIKQDKEIKDGELFCFCGKKYFIKDYIPRFVDGDNYVKNFSFEWTKHRKTQLDSYLMMDYSGKKFFNKTGFKKNKFKNKLFLDVGCGSGRYSEVVLKYGGIIIGCDMSYSIDAAFKNMGQNKRAHFIQVDIFNLPFVEGTFDYIFSIGVLHHTPNPRLAFSKLVPLLKKNGELAIWVYGKNYATKNSIMWRKITTRLPKQVLYYIIYIFSPFHFINKMFYRFSFLSKLMHMIMPGFLYHGFPFINDQPFYDWFVLCTFDYYSPKYQFYFDTKEIYTWFKEEELRDIELLEPQVAVRGIK